MSNECGASHECRKIDPRDAAQVANELLRLANYADRRGERKFLDETERRHLACKLRILANAIDPAECRDRCEHSREIPFSGTVRIG